MTLTIAETRVLVGLKAGDGSRDVRLAQLLGAAYEQAATHIGPLRTRAVTETAVLSGGRIFLRRRPVSAVSSIAGITALTDIEIDSPSGLVDGVPSSVLDGNVTVTYTTGYAVYPASVEEGIRLWVRHRWTLESYGTDTYGDTAVDGVTDFSGLPNAVRNVWGPSLLDPMGGFA